MNKLIKTTLTLIIFSFSSGIFAENYPDTIYFSCTNNDFVGAIRYSRTYPADCKNITVHRIVSKYTKEDIREMARQQIAYDKQEYRKRVKAVARFLNDVQKAR